MRVPCGNHSAPITIRPPTVIRSAECSRADRVLTQMLETSTSMKKTSGRTGGAPLKIIRTQFRGVKRLFRGQVKDHLLDKYSENELLSENFRVYTTLDPALQRAAAAAVDAGMKKVDLLLAKKYEKWRKELAKKGSSRTCPAAASRAVRWPAHRGDQSRHWRARYGLSQLNHALARRQPGSVFKPLFMPLLRQCR